MTLGFIATSKDNQKPRINSVKKKMLVARSRISEKDVLGSSSGAGLLLPLLLKERVAWEMAGRMMEEEEEDEETEDVAPRRNARARSCEAMCLGAVMRCVGGVGIVG